MAQSVRPAAVAGMFYPGGKSTLQSEVAAYLDEARVEAGTRVHAPKILLVPHAGYVYSAPIAARAYALLREQRLRIRRVVLAGPTHRVALRGIAVPTVDAFETPLGRVPVDRGAIAGLADLPQIVAHDGAHEAEHSLEVQLPFLQTVLEDFMLVPLAVGHVEPARVAEVLERLWGGEETLLVISSDLSHYLPYDRANAVDRRTVQHILRLDPTLDHSQACGATPLAAALMTAHAHGLEPRLLDLRNSGDTAGDRARVVGYCSVAFEADPSGSAVSSEAGQEQPAEDAAGQADLGSALTSRARNAIASAFGLAGLHEPAHTALLQHGATFVTLNQDGALRGCIGSLQAHRSLEHDVRHNARAAAFQDPRFDPVQARDLPSLQIEVSLLGSAQALSACSEAEILQTLRPGVDGVILQWRSQRATFLPQVWDQLPAPQAFLEALKRKAGLDSGFWSPELRLWRYGVRKFSEAAAA